MKRREKMEEERYEIIIKKLGDDEPVETDVMGDSETREILHLIGRLNLRGAV